MEETTASTSTSTGQWTAERTPSTSTQGRDTSNEINTTEEYSTAEEGTTDGEVADHGEEPAFYPVFSDTEEETEIVYMTPRAGVVFPRRMSI